MQSGEGASATKVIAHANPLMLAATLALFGVGLLLHVPTLNDNGWLNPEAFVGVISSRKAWFYDIPFVGHAIVAVLAGFTGVATLKLALLSARGFKDVIFDRERLYYASRPWMGKSAKSDIFVRVLPPSEQGLLSSNGIEIVHLVRRRSGKERRSVRLKPTLQYLESLEQIVANLEACGIEVRGRPSPASQPIWERDRTD